MDKLKILVSMAQQGMSAEQIRAAMDAAFGNPTQVQTQQPTPEQVQQITQTMAQPAQAVPAAQPAAPDMSAMFTMLSDKLDTMTNAMRSGAIMHSQQPPAQTAEGVMDQMFANILGPDNKEV